MFLDELLGEDDYWHLLAQKAQAVAEHAHAGQVDKAGRPYIDHPARVATRCAEWGLQYVTVAWLHDVIEDTMWGLDDLRLADFPNEVIRAVDALTRREGERYMTFVGRCYLNDIARKVKIADIEDNTDPERIARLDRKTAERLLGKYERAKALLTHPDPFGAVEEPWGA